MKKSYKSVYQDFKPPPWKIFYLLIRCFCLKPVCPPLVKLIKLKLINSLF